MVNSLLGFALGIAILIIIHQHSEIGELTRKSDNNRDDHLNEINRMKKMYEERLSMQEQEFQKELRITKLSYELFLKKEKGELTEDDIRNAFDWR